MRTPLVVNSFEVARKIMMDSRSHRSTSSAISSSQIDRSYPRALNFLPVSWENQDGRWLSFFEALDIDFSDLKILERLQKITSYRRD
ncbi:hypothetical protein DKX38_012592 [Salix brachista]|uniref:Uncharacterized protein n=1 Tax=Salix brachista TaxID=2182728 RepID=A0A5N5LPA4_9ROSI|nr:hypothetical protein DKX38_012592 [Salix brachista]